MPRGLDADKRSCLSQESVYLAANFDDVRSKQDWSRYTSYGNYISDSAGLMSGKLQLNDITIPKETALMFADII